MNLESTGARPEQSDAIGPGIVAGIGARGSATTEDVLHLLDACLGDVGFGRNGVVALATLDRKAAHPALQQAAAVLGIPVLAVPQDGLRAPGPNPSALVTRYIGVPSVAEAAALAFGPLLMEKRRGANVTCALSQHLPDYAMPISSAVNAASTLSTSSAGP